MGGGHGTTVISVDVVFREYIAWLYWVKQLAYQVLPDGVAGTIFRLPALVLFPVRVLVSTLVGIWAFSVVKRLRNGSAVSEAAAPSSKQ